NNGNTCQTIPVLNSGQQVPIEMPFTAPGSNQVLDVVATASSPDLGIRTSTPMRVLVGCEPFFVVPPTPDPNPQETDLPDVSVTMQGGTAYRYARILRRDTGAPLASGAVTLSVIDSAGTKTSVAMTTDANGNILTNGVLGVGVPVGKTLPANTKITATID